MTCSNIQERFVEYLTGQLSEKESEEIRAHVA
ncbi:MAG TPA: zf-HC2 domain-containing protein [Candidatus Aminicenantes bacterium]|nr:zf-HC2 domain-containing protein [Candidatus Aminicenantes bacterium]